MTKDEEKEMELKVRRSYVFRSFPKMLRLNIIESALNATEEDPIILIPADSTLDNLWKAVCVSYTKRFANDIAYHYKDITENFKHGEYKFLYVIY